MLHAVSFFASVAPHLSVASVMRAAVGADMLDRKRAQSSRFGSVTKRAEKALCATCPGLGSQKKCSVMPMRAMDLS